MTGLDTNVIVRYLAQDDPAQSRAATHLIESFSAEEPGFIGLVVIVELVWVLQKSYTSSRVSIEKVLESLLQTKELAIERADLVGQALRSFSAGRADFSDCLIQRCAEAAGCTHTFTFDRGASGGAGMQLLK